MCAYSNGSKQHKPTIIGTFPVLQLNVQPANEVNKGNTEAGNEVMAPCTSLEDVRKSYEWVCGLAHSNVCFKCISRPPPNMYCISITRTDSLLRPHIPAGLKRPLQSDPPGLRNSAPTPSSPSSLFS